MTNDGTQHFKWKPQMHWLSTICLGPLAQNTIASLQFCRGGTFRLYILREKTTVFLYQWFFLGNAVSIAHISVKVLSLKNDTDSYKIYIKTSFVDFLPNFIGELSLWPPSILAAI